MPDVEPLRRSTGRGHHRVLGATGRYDSFGNTWEVWLPMDRADEPRHEGWRPEWVDRDEALARLEDLLLGLPLDRAVPDLHELLARAEVDEDLLRRDDRALKLLHEALVARPFGSLDAVQRVKTEVELLTLEVELLTDLLADPGIDRGDAARASARLVDVRARLEEVRDQL